MTKIDTLELAVKGGEPIHCVGCENRIQSVISKLPGVLKVKANHKTREKLDFMGYKTS